MPHRTPPGDKSKSASQRLKDSSMQLRGIYLGRKRTIDNLREGLREYFASDTRFYAVFGTAVFAVAFAIFVPASNLTSEVFREGEVVHRNIYAPADLTVEDQASTYKKRMQVSESVRDIYSLDTSVLRSADEKLKKAIAIMQQGYSRNEPAAYRSVMRGLEERELMELGPAGAAMAESRLVSQEALRRYESTTGFANLEKLFRDELGIPMPKEAVDVLRAHHYRPHIGEWLSAVLAEAMETGVATDKKALPPTSHKGIALVNAQSGENAGSLDYQDIMDVQEARLFVRTRLGELMASQPLSLQKVATAMAENLVSPNLFYNRAKTVERRKSVRDAVPVISYQVKKGELIVREGERMTPEHLAKIKMVGSGQRFGGTAQAVVGSMAFILMVILGCGFYVRSHMPELAATRPNAALIGIILLAQAALLRMFQAWAEVFATHNPDVSLSAYLYAAPFAVAPLLAAIFFTRGAAVLAAIVTALSAGMLFQPTHHYIFIAFAGGIVAVFHVGRIMRRSEVWRFGVRLMGVNVAVTAMVWMMDGQLFTRDSFNSMLFCIVGSVITVALALTLSPLVESYFPVVSDIRLLELLDLNHPLLAKMAVVAPGTYHHSIIVGNLAEDAAEAIGANPLLARVGAYFHDIGKTHKPEYFIENQRDNVNKHDNLNPSMSALIITSHVTRGLEMAREHKLIPQIKDMITEHHGTQLVEYFYHRAKEAEKDGAPVSEQNFRYPGRKPHSRESAIVALADVVEAASRTLKSPTSSRLRQLVSKTINDKFVNGQLDQSHLTLHDLNKIGDSFVRTLHGIFHYRVEYPGDKIEDEDNANLKAAGQRAEFQQDKEKASPNIKRVV